MTPRRDRLSRIFLAAAIASALFLPQALVVPQALAGLTRDELSSVGFSVRPGTALPLDAVLTDAGGATRSLGERLAGRPGLVAFVDFTCTTICGVAANVLARSEQALADSGGLDHRILVVGFDARDTARDRDDWLAGSRKPRPRRDRGGRSGGDGAPR